MSKLVRKINKAKWMQVDIEANVPASADAITNCMKTNLNTLSVWEIDDVGNIDEAALAIVGSNTNLDAIDLVVFDSEFIDANKIRVNNTEGDTAAIDKRNTHRDLADLNYDHLGILSRQVVNELREDKVKRFTMGKLKQILREAIQEKRIDLDRLSEDIQKKL